MNRQSDATGAAPSLTGWLQSPLAAKLATGEWRKTPQRRRTAETLGRGRKLGFGVVMTPSLTKSGVHQRSLAQGKRTSALTWCEPTPKRTTRTIAFYADARVTR